MYFDGGVPVSRIVIIFNRKTTGTSKCDYTHSKKEDKINLLITDATI